MMLLLPSDKQCRWWHASGKSIVLNRFLCNNSIEVKGSEQHLHSQSYKLFLHTNVHIIPLTKFWYINYSFINDQISAVMTIVQPFSFENHFLITFPKNNSQAHNSQIILWCRYFTVVMKWYEMNILSLITDVYWRNKIYDRWYSQI